jgi:AcrR family transcriptional regulator
MPVTGKCQWPAQEGDMDNLRERKKALTRDTIEGRALELFLDRGYDRVRVEDICADALVSQRTFFRYYASKEDLVLGRLRAHLMQAARLFDTRPAGEPLTDSLRAVITRVAQDYVTEPERELARLRLVTTTPALEAGLLNVFAGFERLVRTFVANRLDISPEARRARLLGAATVCAFRVGLELWIDEEAVPDLPTLVMTNVNELLP